MSWKKLLKSESSPQEREWISEYAGENALEALADYVEVLKFEPSLGASWLRKGLAIERLCQYEQ